MNSTDRDDLWEYAAITYARPGVAARCLALQDEHQLDVNVLLYCFWLARPQSHPAMVDWPGLVEQTGHWQTRVVSRLRRLRRGLKSTAATSERASLLRDRLIDCELGAEAVEQAALPGWAGPPGECSTTSSSSQDAAQHLCAYCRALNMQLDDTLIEALARLLAQVYAMTLPSARAILVAAACVGLKAR